MPRKPEEVVGPQSARITGRCESSNINYWNWTQVLWKVSKSASHVAISRAPKLKILVKKKKTVYGKNVIWTYNIENISFEDRVITKMMNYMLNISEFSKDGMLLGREQGEKLLSKLYQNFSCWEIKNIRQNTICYNMSSLIYMLKCLLLELQNGSLFRYKVPP